jgi:RHS repeat-associated protein
MPIAPPNGWFGGYPVAPWYPVVPPAAPVLPQYQIVEKSYVLDYTSALKDVIMETENQGLTFRNTYGLEKFSVKVAGAKAYIHHDRLGSVDFTTDAAGNTLSYVNYDPWGVAVTTSPWTLGSRKIDLVAEYTGHPYDVVLGLYFAEARMYDAADRRFVANDPVRGGVVNPLSLNRYAYVIDNPLYWIDPWGLAAYSVKSGNGYTLFVSPQGLDATESGLGMVPVIGWGFTVLESATKRLAGFRTIDYDLESIVGNAFSIADYVVDNKVYKVVSKWAGRILIATEVLGYAYDWFYAKQYQLEEAIYNHFDRNT